MDKLISVQLIIAYYMFVSLTLLVFNLLHILFQRSTDIRYRRSIREWTRRLSAPGTLTGIGADSAHQAMIRKKLQRMSGLMGFYKSMQRMEKTREAADIEAYLRDCYPGFCDLAMIYARRSDMDKAFLAFVLSRFPPKGQEMDDLEESMLRFLIGTNMYCRENALRALCSFGSVDAVVRAFELLAEHRVFHHEMMLVQALKSFSGDKDALAGHLAGHIASWPAHMGEAVVRFIDACSGDHRRIMFEVLSKSGIDTAVLSAALEYFGSHLYEPVRPMLIEYLGQVDRMVPKLAVSAAAALCAYPGQESVEALLSALCSPNWYVRANAALSLLILGVDSRELDETLAKDPYASDMMRYQAQGQLPQRVLRWKK